MKRLDLIIDALETGLKLTDGFISEWNQIHKALAAAKELRNMKPVARVDDGEKFDVFLYDQLPTGTKLYALDEVKE